ncbi:sphingoid long chain base kinase-like protein [Rhizodiscina lignyota]|uniref:Sphingoid long chain base kinase-like protein n=1 Tax=Rhizodiscina lignyota TaxID=1504668 RepID=A0A9P4I8V9_9PEZI|nr:sphingoid long chain base kinase-like protein [Rhizodiscina lignyota]
MANGSENSERDPFVDPPAAATSEQASGDATATLACGRDVALTLGKEGLIIIETVPTRSISYFHILWAEQDDSDIFIHYAQAKSSSVLRAATLSYPLEKPSSTDVQPWIERLLDRAYGSAQRRKRIKVLVNPFGGKGGAARYYTRDIEPIFAAARCEIDVERTQFSGHAVELAEQLDPDKWDVVACCSGDGVPHEVFNGLAKQKDARKALRQIAVAQMPCGSGNAMSINLNGTTSCSVAAVCVVKGLRRPLDLVSITQGDKRFFSFLSQSVGIVAESDLGTDHLRWMGDFRFTWGFLVRLLGKTVYPCDIAVAIEIADKAAIRDAYHRGIEEAAAHLPANQINNDNLLENGHVAGAEDETDLPPLRYGTIKDPLPEGWTLVPHDTIGNFFAGNMAYMAADANFFSASLPSDGYLDLIRIDGLIKRRLALQMLTAVESGKLFGMDAVDYTKISGYRIIPKSREDGYISIDGERVPFEQYQAEVHKGLGTVLMRDGRRY